MRQLPETTLSWRTGLRAVAAAWKPLLLYELVMSLCITLVVGPLLLALSYRLIELSGEPVLGNTELAHFLLSPLGLLALVLGLSVTLSLLLVQYSGLILLADSALRGAALSLRRVLAGVAGSSVRLFGLAMLQTCFTLLVAVPFLGLAAGVYWVLLSGTDINFYLTQRPPRFWVAVLLGIVLAGGFAAVTIWFLVRWALAVPGCVLDGQAGIAALCASTRLMRGRAWRLVLLIGGWQLLKQILLIAAIAGLDQLNRVLFATLEGRLSLLVGSTVVLLVIDAIVLQLIGAVFAIGLAALLAYEYEQARRSQTEPGSIELSDRTASLALAGPPWRARAAVVAIVVLGPIASMVYALGLSRQIVEHRTTRVTAHRAGSKAAPENSIAALRISMAVGADFAEIDVQQTADGQVVLLHDRDLKRTTGDRRVLNEVKLADIRDLRLRDSRGTIDEGLPTLAELLSACDEHIRLNVELKDFGRTPGLALAVLAVLREHDFTSRSIVSCFQMGPLRELKQAEPTLPVGIILSAIQGDMTRLPVDFLSLHQRLVRSDLVRRAHARGMEVHAWTVNDRESAVRLLDLGCDNLITSDPALMREVVDWYAGLGDAERMLLRLRRWMRE